MLAMPDNEEHVVVSIRFDAASIRADPSPTTDAQPGVPRHTADMFSVRLLEALGPDQDVAVVSVHGEIDLATAPMLREALVPVLERDRGPVVVDLSEVEFMDSSGVHVLVDTLQRLEPRHRRLAIACREDSQVYRLLAVVGLLDMVAVHRSRDSAVTGGDDYPESNLAALGQKYLLPTRPLNLSGS